MSTQKDENAREKLDAKRKLHNLSLEIERIAKRLLFAEMPNEASCLKNAIKQLKKAERSL